ncbi:MAG: hypothetical protein WAS33_07590 [Candidatus Promineifilaceae bacterium]
MTRHLISRSQQMVVLVLLLLALATAVLSATHAIPTNLIDAAPAPIQVTDGWEDPVGG